MSFEVLINTGHESWWRILLTILESLAITAAGVTAVYGLVSWRQEARGKRRLELAEDVLSSLYEAKEAISYIRHPGGTANEGAEEMMEAEGEIREPIPPQYVVQHRYRESQEVFERLHKVRYKLMAHFGEEFGEPIEELARTVRRIQLAAQSVEVWKKQLEMEQRRGRQSSSALERIQQAENVFWNDPAKPDEIAEKVKRLVGEIKSETEPILGTKQQRRWWQRRKSKSEQTASQ